METTFTHTYAFLLVICLVIKTGTAEGIFNLHHYDDTSSIIMVSIVR